MIGKKPIAMAGISPQARLRVRPSRNKPSPDAARAATGKAKIGNLPRRLANSGVLASAMTSKKEKKLTGEQRIRENSKCFQRTVGNQMLGVKRDFPWSVFRWLTLELSGRCRDKV